MYCVVQCVAVRCRVLPCVAVCRSVSKCVAVCRGVSQCVAAYEYGWQDPCVSVLHRIRICDKTLGSYPTCAVCCSVLQCVAVCSSLLERVAVCCIELDYVTRLLEAILQVQCVGVWWMVLHGVGM